MRQAALLPRRNSAKLLPSMADLSVASLKPFVFGLASHVPGLYPLLTRTGGSDNPRYCYSVWLRHLVTTNAYGALSGVPRKVAEIGPGDSIGIGLAALLSGAQEYASVDVRQYANPTKNLAILRELIAMFRSKLPIPDDAEFPMVSPRLASYEFPSHIVTDDVLSQSLSQERIDAIVSGIRTSNNVYRPGAPVTYVAPWTRLEVLPAGAFDLVYSQAALEHVDQLEQMYAAINYWTRSGGATSHDIDMTSHGMGSRWNSHWSYSRLAWKLIRGRRAFLLNRMPHSVHSEAIQRHGFRILANVTTPESNGIDRVQLAEPFRGLSDDDFTTMEAYVLAVKS
jgi:hypothetical protein